jgi:hypothetical protein
VNNAITRWEIIGYREGLRAVAGGRDYCGSGILWEYQTEVEASAFCAGFDIGIRGGLPLPCWGL